MAAPAFRTRRTRHAIDGAEPLRGTKNDLSESARLNAVRHLNARLADAVDLKTICKQAHWNVRGPQFIALHKLFDHVAEDVDEYADLIAERIGQLGGIAEGTARVAAQRSSLSDYPATLFSGDEHVAALSDVLAQFAHATRAGIAEMDELGDAVSADIFTEIARGTDKWLWFVESHQTRQ